MKYSFGDLVTEFYDIQNKVPTYRIGQMFISRFIEDSSFIEMQILWNEQDVGKALGVISGVICENGWDFNDLPLREGY